MRWLRRRLGRDRLRRSGLLALHPLVQQLVLLYIHQHLFHCLFSLKGHEAEASRFACVSILHDLAMSNFAIFGEIGGELVLSEIVRKATDEDLARLIVSRRLR